MKKKNIFFPVLGCLSGAAGVVSGFVFACSVKGTVSALTEKAVIDSADQNYDFYSYFFGGGTMSSNVDDTALMAAKLVEICGKGFGLLLIFAGIFAVCYFGYKIERAFSAPAFPPVFMPEGFPVDAPVDSPVAQDAYPVGDYSAPAQDFAAPDEGVYPPEKEYPAADENHAPANDFTQPVDGGYPQEENSGS